MGWMQLQHHDRDDDRNHPVAEGLQSVLGHVSFVIWEDWDHIQKKADPFRDQLFKEELKFLEC